MSDRAAQLTALLSECTPAELQELKLLVEKWPSERSQSVAGEDRRKRFLRAKTEIFQQYDHLLGELAK